MEIVETNLRHQKTQRKLTEDEDIILAVIGEYDKLHSAHVAMVRGDLERRLVLSKFEDGCG